MGQLIKYYEYRSSQLAMNCNIDPRYQVLAEMTCNVGWVTVCNQFTVCCIAVAYCTHKYPSSYSGPGVWAEGNVTEM